MNNFKAKSLGAVAATALILAAGTAIAENVITVNATQIFGTVDPAKVNDGRESV